MIDDWKSVVYGIANSESFDVLPQKIRALVGIFNVYIIMLDCYKDVIKI